MLSNDTAKNLLMIDSEIRPKTANKQAFLKSTSQKSKAIINVYKFYHQVLIIALYRRVNRPNHHKYFKHKLF